MKTEIKQVLIPLYDAPWAIIQIPVPMTEENWRQIEEWLKLMKPIVVIPVDESAILAH